MLIAIVFYLVVFRIELAKSERASFLPYIAYSCGGPASNEPIYRLSANDLKEIYIFCADKLTNDQLLVGQAARYALLHEGKYLFLDECLVTEDIISTVDIIMLCPEVKEVGYSSFQITGKEVSGVLFIS